MRTTGNLHHAALGGDGRPFGQRRDLVVGLDGAWTRHRRPGSPGGLFCYSLALVARPERPAPVVGVLGRVGLRARYLDEDTEAPALAARLDADLAVIEGEGWVLVGHQLPGTLAVAGLAGGQLPGIGRTLRACRSRADTPGWIVDTHDTHPARAAGRGGVDCDGPLAVEHPELRGPSLAAIHRTFLATGDERCHRRAVAVSLRRALATLAAGLVGLGLARPGPVDVDAVLAAHLWDQLPHLDPAGSLDAGMGGAC